MIETGRRRGRRPYTAGLTVVPVSAPARRRARWCLVFAQIAVPILVEVGEVLRGSVELVLRNQTVTVPVQTFHEAASPAALATLTTPAALSALAALAALAKLASLAALAALAALAKLASLASLAGLAALSALSALAALAALATLAKLTALSALTPAGRRSLGRLVLTQVAVPILVEVGEVLGGPVEFVLGNAAVTVAVQTFHETAGPAALAALAKLSALSALAPAALATLAKLSALSALSALAPAALSGLAELSVLAALAELSALAPAGRRSLGRFVFAQVTVPILVKVGEVLRGSVELVPGNPAVTVAVQTFDEISAWRSIA